MLAGYRSMHGRALSSWKLSVWNLESILVIVRYITQVAQLILLLIALIVLVQVRDSYSGFSA
jgi:hypothetical protein